MRDTAVYQGSFLTPPRIRRALGANEKVDSINDESRFLEEGIKQLKSQLNLNGEHEQVSRNFSFGTRVYSVDNDDDWVYKLFWLNSPQVTQTKRDINTAFETERTVLYDKSLQPKDGQTIIIIPAKKNGEFTIGAQRIGWIQLAKATQLPKYSDEVGESLKACLNRFHSCNFTHGDVSYSNFVIYKTDVVLIDFEKSTRHVTQDDTFQASCKLDKDCLQDVLERRRKTCVHDLRDGKKDDNLDLDELRIRKRTPTI